MYKEVVDEANIKQPVEKTSRIATYELGDIHKILVYIEQFGTAGYLGELKLAHADLTTMVGLLGEQLGYDLNEQRDIGFECFCHRIAEVKKAGLSLKEKPE